MSRTAQKQLSGKLERIAPYIGVAYSTYVREVLIPVGASIGVREDLILVPMSDGKYIHTTLTWFGKRAESISLVAAFNKRMGIAFARNF